MLHGLSNCVVEVDVFSDDSCFQSLVVLIVAGVQTLQKKARFGLPEVLCLISSSRICDPPKEPFR